MREKIKSVVTGCMSNDAGICSNALREIAAGGSYTAEEKKEIAAGLASLFYRDTFENEKMNQVLNLVVKSMIDLGTEIIPYIIEQLEDADAETAQSFGRVLGGIGAPSIDPLLAEIKNSARSSYAKINCLVALGCFETPEIARAVPVINDCAASSDSMIKAQAVHTLGRIANRVVASDLEESVRWSMFDAAYAAVSDPKPAVRRHAVRALSKMQINHYLDKEQYEKTYQCFRGMMGLDNMEWDHAYIVRAEVDASLHFFNLQPNSHNLPVTHTADRYRQDYKIIAKKELAPGTYHFKVSAPLIARKIVAGQFVIIRPNAHSERIPLSICGWNREEGYIELIIMAIGRTSKEATAKNVGDSFQDVVGPLGQRSHVEKYEGACVLLGGGFGTGAIIPTARDLKELGNRVIGVIGARSKDLVLMEQELREVCDEVIITTNDGSSGMQGMVTDAMKMIMDREPVSFALAVGPVPMMKAISDQTRDTGVSAFVSLNAIMVDGTGMCGACRVTVGGKTKFACFHGPDFDGHQVDFEELSKRLKMFVEKEKVAMETAAV